ncbi:hypothetical protein N7462_001884 [Penicillium macrosclerotiorum]|uniref:uncharacterized protein n=1 Tax=Penicillium macrosclerotiorum TaxID=303699 RepID=UPI00254915D2|nr:uncharacterized protein N7462_001884 [Penicillium macrosclerotiorum]KAJ5692461.1 hypothetical protein N7462_001884 [Penicillium macrosclerotiorum]
MDVTNSTVNLTALLQCNYTKDAMPSLPFKIERYTEVPLYQTDKLDTNFTQILQSCCNTTVWIYSNPKPCTAVCNSTTWEDVAAVRDCLNQQRSDFGGDNEKSSGSMPQMAVTRNTLTLLLVSGLVLTGLFV